MFLAAKLTLNYTGGTSTKLNRRAIRVFVTLSWLGRGRAFIGVLLKGPLWGPSHMGQSMANRKMHVITVSAGPRRPGTEPLAQPTVPSS
jgi:hypothetical protein